MPENENTPTMEANSVNTEAETVSPVKESETSVSHEDVKNNESKKEVTYSEEQFNNATAKARGAAERDTKAKLMKSLGLRPDEDDKLEAMKQAYQDSLSDEEKKQEQISNLESEKEQLIRNCEEKDYIIKALTKLTGKSEADVQDIVDMAKGLKKDDNTIEDAIEKVISKINPPSTTEVPKGQNLQQPSETVVTESVNNPFKTGNLTEQSLLRKNNPELARKLCVEAGFVPNF